MRKKTTDAIILAAGSGNRFNQNLPKQFTKISKVNLIEISIRKILRIKSIRNVYITINQKHKKFLKGLKKKINFIEGGKTRTISVFRSLEFIKNLPDPPDNILIHDSARPCVSDIDLKNIMSASNSSISGIALGYPLTHALKLVNKNNNIINNIKKKNLWLAFTPQLFDFIKIYKSYKKAITKKIEVDDDSQAMSLLSYKVRLIFSSYRNIKVTYLDDFSVVKDLLR